MIQEVFWCYETLIAQYHNDIAIKTRRIKTDV
jgi:hypothetical protein